MDSSWVVLLYYKYTRIDDVDAMVEWQKKLCEKLGLKGRIRIAREGINGTAGGSKESTDRYVEEMSKHPLFGDIDWKTSSGQYYHFDELIIRPCKEIVTLGVDDDSLLSKKGTDLSPSEFHDAMAGALEHPEDHVIIDCRNGYESKVGYFENAIRPDTRQFSDFPKYIKQTADELRGKRILMYCTGGIRCEKGSAFLKSQGLDEVYQLQGGIHRYLEQYPNGYFRGKNFVFDDRILVDPGTNEVVGKCDYCETPCEDYSPKIRCCRCRLLLLVCENCQQARETFTCAKHAAASS